MNLLRTLTAGAVGLLLAACAGREPAPAANADAPPPPQDTVQEKILALPPCDGFDFPVGPPDGRAYYNAQGFTRNHHLGDDWNGVGGGNSDLGDPVYAVADGVVTEAADMGGGWGNVVRIVHNAGDSARPRRVESLYAHLDTMRVQRGQSIRRGTQLGTIGTAHGAYWAHLHLEIRREPGLPLGGGYSADTTGYLDPTAFIRKHRPRR